MCAGHGMQEGGMGGFVGSVCSMKPATSHSFNLWTSSCHLSERPFEFDSPALAKHEYEGNWVKCLLNTRHWIRLFNDPFLL